MLTTGSPLNMPHSENYVVWFWLRGLEVDLVAVYQPLAIHSFTWQNLSRPLEIATIDTTRSLLSLHSPSTPEFSRFDKV